MNIRTVCCVMFTIFLTAFGSMWVRAQEVLVSEPPSSLRKVLPGQVAQLASWPTAEQRARTAVQPMASQETIRAGHRSIAWIQKIIDPQWLPDNAEDTLLAKLVLLEKAYDGLDTSHVEWESNGYHLRASQTRTVFYVSITPTRGTIVVGDAEAQREACFQLAWKVINEIPVVMRSWGKDAKIAERGTKAIIKEKSFDKAKIEQFEHGLVAAPAQVEFGDRLDSSRTDFWWRIVGWWTDGRTLGLFTVKSEGGAWAAGYGSAMDAYWFTEDPPAWRRVVSPQKE